MLNSSSIFPVTSHTNHVGQGSTFVAVQGHKENGVAYILQALQKGATTIVVDEKVELTAEILQAIATVGAVLQKVSNTRAALAELSAQAAGYPAQKLKIIGITGTKGKTSTTFILEHILRASGYKTALLGTVKNSINGQDVPAHLTTPQPDYLHQFLKICVHQGVQYVVMEVAAQALSLHRVDTILFDGVIFTNFAPEHAEFYASVPEYFAAKRLIFNKLKPQGFCLVNADDEYGKQILTKHSAFESYGLQHNPVKDLKSDCTVVWQEQTINFSCPALIGKFNSYNLMASVRMALNFGLTPEEIQQSLQTFTGVPGRLEMYQLPNGALGVIDYAHNPSSFQAILSTLRGMTDHLLVVFGCGGDRDVTKRPVMGALAAEYADLVFVTADNPRSEKPEDICQQIMHGISAPMQAHVHLELDREQAIKLAYAHAKKGSIIALLGKGPDEYQQVGTVKLPFSEKTILKNL